MQKNLIKPPTKAVSYRLDWSFVTHSFYSSASHTEADLLARASAGLGRLLFPVPSSSAPSVRRCFRQPDRGPVCLVSHFRHQKKVWSGLGPAGLSSAGIAASRVSSPSLRSIRAKRPTGREYDSLSGSPCYFECKSRTK